MRLAGITVSVGYADYLTKVIAPWKNGLDGLAVVTTPADVNTQRVCAAAGVPCLYCDRFFSNGAYFNKAAGLNDAVDYCGGGLDWVICFDADILPPVDWRDRITTPEPGILYGAERGELDPIPAGWLMLFHARDPHAQQRPLFVEYNNASGYDTEFAGRWPAAQRRWLPFDVRHLGRPGEDWCGRGNEAGMQQLLNARSQRGGWEHERMVVSNV